MRWINVSEFFVVYVADCDQKIALPCPFFWSLSAEPGPAGQASAAESQCA